LIWSIDEFFHFGFPDGGVTLKGRAGEPEREMFYLKRVRLDEVKERMLTGRKYIDRPYTSTAGDAICKNVYAFFCED